MRVRRILIFGLVLAGSYLLLACGGGREVGVSRLRVEYVEHPLGVDMPDPRFSWVVEGRERGASQSAYQVLVSRSEDNIRQETGEVWDSGKVQSDQSFQVVYGGSELRSSRKYYWKVRVWNQEGVPSEWSEVSEFVTGLLHPDDWQGQWIGAADSTVSAPLLRKEFDLSEQVKSAYLFVSGMGYFQLYLNGEEVTEPGINPAETEYGKRVMYLTYDVTGALQQGANALGIMLGNGQFHITRAAHRYNKGAQRYPSPYGLPRAILQLNVTFTDNSTVSIVTDNSWRMSAGPITYNNFYSGEDYDARLEQSGWTATGFDDSRWKPAVVTDQPGRLVSQVMPRMVETRILEPARQTQSDDGVYLFDLGQNIPGYWYIRVRGQAGTVLRIRGAETLNNQRFPKDLAPGDSLSTMHDYHRDAYTTYTLKGGGPESYRPHFFFTGFRYIEVTADHPEQIESLEAEGRMVHTAVPQTGSFSCSNPLLNQIHQNTMRAQRSNMTSIPTDCPQREKWGWTGDAQLYCEEANHNFFMPAFWSKWLHDIHDAQEIAGAGAVPDVVPNYTEWRGHAAEQWGGSGTPAWGSVYPAIYWYTYNYFNDMRVLREQYQGVKAWADYLTSTAKDHIIPWGRGDWGEPGATADDRWRVQTPVPLTSTAYYYRSVWVVKEAAKILGQTDDADKYSRLAQQIKTAFNNTFFDSTTARYGNNTQTANLVALDFGLVPESYRSRVLENVVSNINEEHDGHLFTGILGTKALVNVLPLEDYGDLMYRIANQTTYPGYGYWVENGATTLWEFWSGRDSHNHAMFGPIDEFFYNDLAGIKAPGSYGTAPGYRTIQIRPQVIGDLQHAEATIETIRGEVSSRWEREDNALFLTVTLPANSRGIVGIPTLGLSDVRVTEGGTVIWEDNQAAGSVSGLQSIRAGEETIDTSVGSGTYQFRLQGEKTAQ